jgi:hypothetical protein
MLLDNRGRANSILFSHKISSTAACGGVIRGIMLKILAIIQDYL